MTMRYQTTQADAANRRQRLRAIAHDAACIRGSDGEPVRVRHDLPPAPGSGAALPERRRASSRRSHRSPGKFAGKSELKTEKTWGQRQGQSGDARRAAAAGIGSYVGKRLFIGEAYDRTIHQIPRRLHGPARRTHQQT
jgi:hypothetical protein